MKRSARRLIWLNPLLGSASYEPLTRGMQAGDWIYAQGIMATTVNGEVLLENSEHTGALPGKVARDTYYYAHNA